MNSKNTKQKTTNKKDKQNKITQTNTQKQKKKENN